MLWWACQKQAHLVSRINHSLAYNLSNQTHLHICADERISGLGDELSFWPIVLQYIPFFIIVICWYIGEIEWLKVLQKKNIGKCLFSVMLSMLAPICAFVTVFYLFPPPNTLLSWYYCKNIMFRCYCYTCTLHLPSRCVTNPLGLSCSLDFRYFTTNFWHFSVYSSRFSPDVRCLTHTTHLYSSHWTCDHT
jgi:hypothetical protein